MRDADDLVRALARSPFRSRFKLGRKERAYVTAKGMDTILVHARSFITTKLAPAVPVNDGKQTPMRGHPVFIAQHATATCCRGCLEKWHAIGRGRALSDEECRYVEVVILGWLTRDLARGSAAPDSAPPEAPAAQLPPARAAPVQGSLFDDDLQEKGR